MQMWRQVPDDRSHDPSVSFYSFKCRTDGGDYNLHWHSFFLWTVFRFQYQVTWEHNESSQMCPCVGHWTEASQLLGRSPIWWNCNCVTTNGSQRTCPASNEVVTCWGTEQFSRWKIESAKQTCGKFEFRNKETFNRMKADSDTSTFDSSQTSSIISFNLQPVYY
jgi:hypothetical protein